MKPIKVFENPNIFLFIARQCGKSMSVLSASGFSVTEIDGRPVVTYDSEKAREFFDRIERQHKLMQIFNKFRRTK